MSEIKLDINLSELFKLSYDFENLKAALGQILKALQSNQKACNDLKKTTDAQSREISKLREEGLEKDVKIKDLTERVKLLEKQTKEHTDQIKENTEASRYHKVTLAGHKERIERLEGITDSLQDKIKNIEAKLEVIGDGGLDLDAIKDLLEKLRRECDEKYVTYDIFTNLKDRFFIVEGKTKEFESQFKNILDAQRKFTTDISRLFDIKADKDELKDLLEKLKRECESKYATLEGLNSLKSLVTILESKSKEFEDKFKSILDAIEKIVRDVTKLFDIKADKADLKDLLDKINSLLQEMEEALKWKQPMVQVTNKIDKIEIQIQQILNGLGKGEGADMSQVADLNQKLQKLRDDFEKFKDDVMRWLRDLQNALANKADLTALKELEKYFLSRLEDLDLKYADKDETKKALKALEKQLKHLFELLMNREGGAKEDDAMFAKKPLGGWSCASCAKDLVNLQGLPAEFVPWKAWPFRDPNEKLAKSGQGFSRIVSKMKPEYVTQPNFYPSASIAEDKNYESLQNEKITIKKKKKMRPMSANRAGKFT